MVVAAAISERTDDAAGCTREAAPAAIRLRQAQSAVTNRGV